MRIPPWLSEWLNIIFRWLHVFAGILWVGSTYYFTWLDGRFQEAEREAEGRDGAEVWMVHSGGFYVVNKVKTPGGRELHWFRWEAALTWLSGFLLLILVYYLSEGMMVDVDVWDISHRTAVLFGVGMIIAGGFVYDVLVRSPLAANDKAFAVVAYALIVGLAYLSTHVVSPRAAFLHLGATFGTIMVANVWMHILPTQRRMIAAAREGRAPDAADAARAKLRSKHNTFMAVPVVFTMISNHYAILGDDYNWLILSALVLAGFVAAKIIRRA